MKRVYWSLLSVSMILAAAGCGGVVTPSAPALTADVTTAPNARPSSAGSVTASVKVEPVQTSSMAFLIAAPVKYVKVEAGDHVSAGQSLIVLDTPSLDYDVSGAQAKLDSAQLNLHLQTSTRQYLVWNGHKYVWTHGMPEVERQANAKAQQAQGALDVARAYQAQGTLFAPFDGTVVAVNVEPGEMVKANQPVLEMGDLSHLHIVTTDLSEREIANVRVGQTAITRLKAFDQDLTGKVIAIAPLSGLNNGDTVFQVTIELDQQPAGLLWGMTGSVEIQTK